MLKSLFKKKATGFTLIEVVIVLAIAGLIFVIVFMAIGQAQKARRDQARQATVSQTTSALEQYAANNSGSYPTSALAATYTSNITDPDTDTAPTYASSNTAAATATSGVQYRSGVKCNGGVMQAGASRQYAVVYWSEGAGASQCKDNT